MPGGRRAYLDHASSSPLRPAAYEAMLPWIGHPGDPGRVHAEGRAARVALEEARERVAAFFGAAARISPNVAHIVTSAVEHSAVLEAANRAGRVTMAGVDVAGRYDPATVLAGIRPETALVAVQLANHEVGTIQPAAEVVAAARERG